jgi:hypothetical protein
MAFPMRVTPKKGSETSKAGGLKTAVTNSTKTTTPSAQARRDAGATKLLSAGLLPYYAGASVSVAG